MATCAALATLLAEAEAAKHKLALGTNVESVQLGEDRSQYTAADPAKLDAYIRGLKAQMQRLRCPGCERSRIVINTIALDANRR